MARNIGTPIDIQESLIEKEGLHFMIHLLPPLPLRRTLSAEMPAEVREGFLGEPLRCFHRGRTALPTADGSAHYVNLVYTSWANYASLFSNVITQTLEIDEGLLSTHPHLFQRLLCPPPCGQTTTPMLCSGNAARPPMTYLNSDCDFREACIIAEDPPQ